MMERWLILAAFALLLAIAVLVSRWGNQQRTRRLALADLPAELLALAAGPAVLYFTTATCAQCRSQQTPALAQVQAQRGDLQLLKLDAVENRALADYYHVMTVPTTVVLDGRRKPVAVNHGLAPAERILAQLAQAAG